MGKILVTYDSGYGATAVVAETIAAILIEKEFRVDLRPEVIEDLAEYDASFDYVVRYVFTTRN